MDFEHLALEDPSQRTILVVDDDPVIRRYLGAQLGRLGCRLLFATNGIEALAAVEQERPDLLLLDIVMPEMDGFEVCRRIKGRLETQGIPVIHLTALSTGDAKEHSFACGADDFLNKPPNFAELRSRIRSHLLILSLLEERAARRHEWAWEPGRPSRILVVIQEPSEREAMVQELGSMAFDVVGVPCLQDALEALKGGLPDLLLLDHALPDGTGSGFASNLRHFARSRDLPILLLTERQHLEAEIPPGEGGPLDYLTRPYQVAELKARTSVLLRHGALLREREANRPGGGGKQLLVDPQTGAYTDAFLEAHLDLLQKALAQTELPVCLLAAGCYGGPQGWAESKDALKQTAALLDSVLRPGEALCRVAERTFVLVLPGSGPEQMKERTALLRQGGFKGTIAGLQVPKRASSASVLQRLAEALQKAGGGIR